MKDEKELILYPNKNGTVADLLEEAKKQIEFSDDSSGKLRHVTIFLQYFKLFITIKCCRFTEINCNKLSMGPKEDTPLDSLQQTKVYRVEEVPK